MTFSTPFHVPGAYHVEGVHPGLFRPPVSVPSPSSDYIPAVESFPKRKRNHEDISRRHALDATDAYTYADSYFNTPAAAAPSHRSYVLAGQLDTPSGAPSEHGILGESGYSDSDYRRVLGSKRPRGDAMDVDEPGPTQLFNLPPQPRPAQTWGSVAFATLGGVVGRVWDFCRSSAFKGFSAGGGKGFDANAVPTSELFDSMIAEKHGGGYHRAQTNRYPTVDTFVASRAEEETYDDDSRASTPTKPAPKRRQTDQSDDLGRNWVMVNEPSRTEKAPRRPPLQQPSPRNRNQAPSVTTGRRKSTPAGRLASTAGQPSRRPTSRLSQANSTPTINPPRPASSASYASPRSPSPSKIPRLATPTQTQSPTTPASSSRRRTTLVPNLTSPGSFSHRRTQSAASAASARTSFHEATENRARVDASPRLDPEAKQLAARRKMEERDADVRMAAFNKRLQDMIRQGKEALGTTIEIDSAGGGGWEDED
ncbi:hypothetical protein HJFPF1_09326 [Paramyrothecium foliicola]|nr:hypothetical protein HJFPF1_09326 [Paramyrothecium foliicola]